MYISAEQTALGKNDKDFKRNVKAAKEFKEATLQNMSDMQKFYAIDELPKAQKPSYKSKRLKIEGNVLVRSTCTSETVFIPAGVTEIGNEAFKNRDRGTYKIVFPEGLKKIGCSAFEGCSNLIEMDVKAPDLCYYADISADDEIDQFYRGFSIFPSSLEEIGDNAFRSFGDNAHGFGQNLMNYLILPQSLTKLGKGAFEDSGVRTIYIAGPQTVSERCFQGSGLRKVIFGDNVKKIERIAFGSCSRLEKVVFGRNIKEIGDWAFDFCGALKKIAFPDSLEKIGKGAFSDCGSLSEIVIPDSVTEIGENAFSKCKNLKEVKIGKGLTAIPECCFSNCSKLKKVIIPDNVTDISPLAFKNCSDFTILGNLGSYAETYAKENNIPFLAL
jgi:hypothetical protein